MNNPVFTPATQAIVVDQVFPHSPETIWKALTTGELISRWLMQPTGFEAVAGTRFTFQTTPAGPWNGVIECKVLEVVACERFAFSWQGGDESNAGYGSRLDTVVTFDLAKHAQGTRLRATHSGFVLPKNDSAFNSMSDGWQKVLPRLGELADTLH